MKNARYSKNVSCMKNVRYRMYGVLEVGRELGSGMYMGVPVL